MRVRPRRRGVTLLELLVATGSAGVLALAALSLLRQSSEAARWRAATSRAESVAQEALAVAGTLIDASVDATVLGDTAVDLRAVVLDAVPCVDGSVARLGSPGPLPAPEDQWFVLERHLTAAGTDSLAWRSSPARPVLEAQERCAVPDAQHPLVRVTGRHRLVAYRSAEGPWMVGLRRCTDRCEPAQPLAGPIRAPVDGGWQVRAVSCGIEVGVRPVGVVAVRRRLVDVC